MEGHPRENVWDRAAREMGKIASPRTDATSAKARNLFSFAAYERGPLKDYQEPMREYDLEDRIGYYSGTQCILVETLIKDIPTTEYSVYLFNDIDAVDRTKIKMSNFPQWTDMDGLQNIFFPHHSPFAQPTNHYHAVIGSGIYPRNRAHDASTNVNVHIGPGGDQHQWDRHRGCYKRLSPFEEKSWSFTVAYGTATCIKFKFEIATLKKERLVFSGEENVVKDRELDQSDWHDTTRVILGQPNHPFKISLNFRFVQSQNTDPETVSKTDVEMFSMLHARLVGNPVTSSAKGRTVTTYTYLVTLMHG